MPRRRKGTGRAWTQEQKDAMSAWQKQRHATDSDFHDKALGALDKGRRSRKLPFTNKEDLRLYTKIRNMQPRTLTNRERKILIDAVLESREEAEIVEELAENGSETGE